MTDSTMPYDVVAMRATSASMNDEQLVVMQQELAAMKEIMALLKSRFPLALVAFEGCTGYGIVGTGDPVKLCDLKTWLAQTIERDAPHAFARLNSQ